MILSIDPIIPRKEKISWVVNQPVIDPRNGKHAFILTKDQDIWYISPKDGRKYLLRMKKGYIYDGASVPPIATPITKLLWGFSLYPDGPLRNPTPSHDRPYELKGCIPIDDLWMEVYLVEGDGKLTRVAYEMSREESDDLFLGIMNYDELIPEKRRLTIHWFLRKLGWTKWNDKKSKPCSER